MATIMDIDCPECSVAELAQYRTKCRSLSVICPPNVGRRHMNQLSVGGVVQDADLVLRQCCRIARETTAEKYGTFKRRIDLTSSTQLGRADHERRCQASPLRKGHDCIKRAFGSDIRLEIIKRLAAAFGGFFIEVREELVIWREKRA